MHLSFQWFHGEAGSLTAEDANLNRIIELVAQLRSDHRLADGASFLSVLERAVRFSHVLIVRVEVSMERRGPIAGIAVLVPVYKLSGFEGHVEDVVVDESFRGQGIGQQIMEQIIQYARVDLDMKRLSLTSDPAKPARATARALYAKLGFTERKGLFRLPLV